jgi:hypothetical protein
MDFTIGIITDGSVDNRVYEIVYSIRSQNIPNYEIIIVGNSNIIDNDIQVIPFNDLLKSKWITRKKNIITENAKYENVVYMHDYVRLDPEWYSGFLKFGDNFKVCMTKMLRPNGSRFRDWTLDAMADIMGILGEERRYQRLLPYDVINLSKIMYISGAYWVAKLDVMKKFPLNEKLSWGESEDIEWSHRIRKHYDFSINVDSSVSLIKDKNSLWVEMSPEVLGIFKKLPEEEMQRIIQSANLYDERTFI